MERGILPAANGVAFERRLIFTRDQIRYARLPTASIAGRMPALHIYLGFAFFTYLSNQLTIS
jgi:hypothetical protein